MQQQDIKDIIELLRNATFDKDFELVSDAIEQLKEYLDDEPDSDLL